MRRGEQYACLLVPEFRAQAVARPRPALHGHPFALLEGEPPLETVQAMNTRARLLGLRRGMTRAEAESFAGVVLVPRCRSAEADARAALLECASSFTPRIEVCEEAASFLCCLDVAGSESLFGSPERMAKSLRARCALVGLSARVAVSGNFHASRLLARGLAGGEGLRVVPPGEEAAALAALPLSVLELEPALAEIFSLWGIRTLGRLAALPAAQLVARLGQPGGRLQQLARGECPHLFQPIEIPFTLEEHVELEEPLDNLESLLFGIAILLDHLIARASLHAYALAAVTVEMALAGREVHRRTVSPRVPTSDRTLWLKLLRLELEAHPAAAPVTGVRVQAEPGCAGQAQLGLFTPQVPEPGRLDTALARIAALVGEENVGSAVLDDTLRREGFHVEPFRVPLREAAAGGARERTCVRRIVPPLEVEVASDGGAPASFLYQGRRCRVERRYGPWLTEGEWWSERAWGEEQWDLIARDEQGSVLYCCVLRDRGRGRWFLAALYD